MGPDFLAKYAKGEPTSYKSLSLTFSTVNLTKSSKTLE